MTAVDLDPATRARQAAAALWGCPRPDKTHHLTEAGALERLAYHQARPGHDPSANVYQCACGGFVWGRRRPTQVH